MTELSERVAEASAAVDRAIEDGAGDEEFAVIEARWIGLLEEQSQAALGAAGNVSAPNAGRAEAESEIARLTAKVEELRPLAMASKVPPYPGAPAPDPGAAAAVGELALAESRLRELQVRLPFLGVTDEALAAEREDRAIALEEATERIRGLPERSARRARAERERMELLAAGADADMEVRSRRDLAGFERARAAAIEARAQREVEATYRAHLFELTERYGVGHWEVARFAEEFKVPKAADVAAARAKVAQEYDARIEAGRREAIVTGGVTASTREG